MENVGKKCSLEKFLNGAPPKTPATLHKKNNAFFFTLQKFKKAPLSKKTNGNISL